MNSNIKTYHILHTTHFLSNMRQLSIIFFRNKYTHKEAKNEFSQLKRFNEFSQLNRFNEEEGR